MVRKNQGKTKLCPFLDQACKKQGCEIYNEKCDRCEIGLLAYNTYLLASAIREQLSALK
jgi:hypothetical protein